MNRSPDHRSNASASETGLLEQQLADYLEFFPDEAATVRRFLLLLADGQAAFHRDHLPGHFTASAVVLSNTGKEILLTHHRKLDIWIQLGGHADGVTDLADAAAREAAEESGLHSIVPASARVLDIDIHPIPAYGSEPAHEHYDVRYFFRANSGAKLVVSDESHDLAWVELSELARYSREESLQRAVRKARNLNSAPDAGRVGRR